jgi:drug/metabolite transporter (DMT)-like permease
MRSPSPAPRSTSTTQLGLLLYLGAVWGGAFLFLRIAAPEVGPLWAAEIRVGLAAILLAVVAGRRTWAAVRGRLRAVALVGATFSAIPFSLIAFASLTLPAGVGALLNAATPLFTALLGVVVLGTMVSRRLAGGLVVGVAAVIVLVGWSPLPDGPGTLVAAAASLGASASYAVGGTFVRRALPDLHGTELATGQLVSGSLLLLPFALASGAPGIPSTDGVIALVAVALVSTALAWPVFFRVLSSTTPTAASTVTFIVPGFAIAWGAIVLGEPIGLGLIAGFGLVLVSLVLVLDVPVAALGRGLTRRVAGRLLPARYGSARIIPPSTGTIEPVT